MVTALTFVERAEHRLDGLYSTVQTRDPGVLIHDYHCDVSAYLPNAEPPADEAAPVLNGQGFVGGYASSVDLPYYQARREPVQGRHEAQVRDARNYNVFG